MSTNARRQVDDSCKISWYASFITTATLILVGSGRCARPPQNRVVSHNVSARTMYLLVANRGKINKS